MIFGEVHRSEFIRISPSYGLRQKRGWYGQNRPEISRDFQRFFYVAHMLTTRKNTISFCDISRMHVFIEMRGIALTDRRLYNCCSFLGMWGDLYCMAHVCLTFAKKLDAIILELFQGRASSKNTSQTITPSHH